MRIRARHLRAGRRRDGRTTVRFGWAPRPSSRPGRDLARSTTPSPAHWIPFCNLGNFSDEKSRRVWFSCDSLMRGIFVVKIDLVLIK